VAKYRSEITREIAAVIKLARSLGYPYAPIAAHYCINQGGIADVMMGRIFPDEPATVELPVGFPPLGRWRKVA
jgi:hypothetical protein